MGEGEPWCSLLCLVTLLLPFIVSELINLFNKNDLHEREQAVVRRGWNKNLGQDKDKVERDKVYGRS